MVNYKTFNANCVKKKLFSLFFFYCTNNLITKSLYMLDHHVIFIRAACGHNIIHYGPWQETGKK